MSFIKNSSIRWGVILLCMILGTWLGLFFQRFAATAVLFANVVDFTIDIRQNQISSWCGSVSSLH